MKDKIRNEPAFPRQETPDTMGYTGMSLRDYFAGQALVGQLMNKLDYGHPPSRVARHSYEFADAMLKERGDE